MENDEKHKNFIFLEKVSESLRKAPGASEGSRKAPGDFWAPGIWRSKISENFTEECFAQHVDGAPSTAPSKISAVQRLIVPATVKWSLHRWSNGVLN